MSWNILLNLKLVKKFQEDMKRENERKRRGNNRKEMC